MRIKYKAWLQDYNEMCEVLLIDFINDEYCVLPSSELEGGSQISRKGIKNLKQFTEFNDCWGNEIFEKDILCNNDIIGYVEFINGAYRLIDKENKEICILTFQLCSKFKIIGNTDENPGLLCQK